MTGLTLGVHDVPVQFRSAQSSWLAELRSLYCPVEAEVPSWHIDITLADALDTTELDRAGIQCSVWKGTRDYIRAELLAGFVDYAAHNGAVQLLGSRSIEAFGALYRTLFVRLALPARQVFVHAAGVVRDEVAYLFVGPSRAGKSTIASMLQNVQILHDDCVFFRTVEGAPRARTLPFMGDMRFYHGKTERCFAVRAIYFLHQDSQPSLVQVRPDEALVKLITAPLPEDHPGFSEQFLPFMESALEMAHRLVETTPCFDLRFSLAELPPGILTVSHASRS